jgi:hypothetical protein
VKTMFCWRCNSDMPMLDEREFDLVRSAARGGVGSQAGSAVAVASVQRPVLELFREITGFAESNPNAVWHHRLALYGPPCSACGKPLRSPRATVCAACGASRALA